METIKSLLDKINEHMHEGRCPTSGCIGECAAIYELCDDLFCAALYIHDNKFNNSSRVARWFYSVGATDVVIKHVLYDKANQFFDGRSDDGVRAWHVEFSMQNLQCPPPLS